MLTLGITGPIGSGKSYVADMICRGGFPKIDTDAVYHGLVDGRSAMTETLVGEFGEEIRAENGGINRKRLSEIVFNDRKRLSRLNALTHKGVTEKTLELIAEEEKNGARLVVVEVPLMFESGFDKHCDYVVSVVADEETRAERICKRNGISEDEAKKRIKNQKNNNFYIENSSFTIYNSDNGDLDAQINRLLERIFKKEQA